MKRTIILATLTVIVAGCASYTAVTSLRTNDVAVSDQAPDTKQYTEKAPGSGEQQLIARTFVGQPPLIPHAIAKYEPITLDENACLDCHVSDEYRGKKMPMMGKSHFSATRKESDGSPSVNMSRWQCNSCHVQQADAQPLIENSFVGQMTK